MAKNTINIGGKEYPFFRTMMSSVLLDESEHAKAAINAESVRSLCFAGFCIVKGACNRENRAFDMSFEEFLNQVDPDLIKKMGELNDVQPDEKKPKAGSSASGSAKA